MRFGDYLHLKLPDVHENSHSLQAKLLYFAFALKQMRTLTFLMLKKYTLKRKQLCHLLF